MNLTSNEMIVLMGLSMVGIYMSNQEWVNIWSRGILVGIGRLFVINLPFVILVNLLLLERI